MLNNGKSLCNLDTTDLEDGTLILPYRYGLILVDTLDRKQKE